MGAFFPIYTEGVLFCSYLVDRRFDLWEMHLMGDLSYGSFFPIYTEGVLFCSYFADKKCDLWEICPIGDIRYVKSPTWRHRWH